MWSLRIDQSGDMPEPPPIRISGPVRPSRRKQVPYGPLAMMASPGFSPPDNSAEKAPFGYCLMMKSSVVPPFGGLAIE